MVIKEINEKEFELCYELDSNTISLWSKSQWKEELKKEGIKAIGLFINQKLAGICLSQVILDEAQISFFAVNKEFQRQGFGSFLMGYVIKESEKLKINRLFLEVSKNNLAAENFYKFFNFSTVGLRKNYYKDGSDALLKEKNLKNK